MGKQNTEEEDVNSYEGLSSPKRDYISKLIQRGVGRPVQSYYYGQK